MSEHHRRLEQMYHSAPTNQLFDNLQLRVDAGTATVQFTVHPKLHHAAGAVHGSYYFKLLDDATYFACNSLVPDVFVLTASFNIELFRPVVAGTMRAVGTVTKPGRTLMFGAADLFDEAGNLVARGSGTFARSKIALDTVPNYADAPTG